MTADAARIRALLTAFSDAHEPQADAELEALHLALMLEDVVDVTLPDDDITLTLADPDHAAQVITRLRDGD